MTDEFTRSQVIERKEMTMRFPEAQKRVMSFVNDDGSNVIDLEVEYEWEPIGCGEGRVICSKPIMPNFFNTSDEYIRIDIADQVGHYHRVKIKIENVEFL